MKSDYLHSATVEHHFWLQTLLEHAQFIHDSLYPSEEKELKKGKKFIHSFEKLLDDPKELSNHNVIAFTKQAETEAEAFMEYKLSLFHRQLTEEINIHLSPACLNQMVLEIKEYLHIIGYLKEGKAVPNLQPLHHHLLWLRVSFLHANTVTESLNSTETQYKEKSLAFYNRLDDMYKTAIEFASYIQSGISAFPALDKFNQDTIAEINAFQMFLDEMTVLASANKLLSKFPNQLFTHMYREQRYYLTKLQASMGMVSKESY